VQEVRSDGVAFCFFDTMSRLKDKYVKQIIPELQKELGLDNRYSVPNLKKVVLNVGVGKVRDNKSYLAEIRKEIALVCGQHLYDRPSRKSIAGFKVREGHLVGLTANLRGERMWSFLDRLFNVALPRTRDFQGLSPKAFDGHGNYTLGIKDHTIFPEIDVNVSGASKSFEVTIVTTVGEDAPARLLLEKLGAPFRKDT